MNSSIILLNKYNISYSYNEVTNILSFLGYGLNLETKQYINIKNYALTGQAEEEVDDTFSFVYDVIRNHIYNSYIAVNNNRLDIVSAIYCKHGAVENSNIEQHFHYSIDKTINSVLIEYMVFERGVKMDVIKREIDLDDDVDYEELKNWLIQTVKELE